MTEDRITPAAMDRHLRRLALHFPQGGRTEGQLALLAEDYATALIEYRAEVIQSARERIQAQERYFPSIAVFREYCGAILAERQAREMERALLEPEDVSEEQRARNARFARLIVRRLRGDAEAAREMDRMLAEGAQA